MNETLVAGLFSIIVALLVFLKKDNRKDHGRTADLLIEAIITVKDLKIICYELVEHMETTNLRIDAHIEHERFHNVKPR